MMKNGEARDSSLEKIEAHLMGALWKNLDDPVLLKRALKTAKKQIKQLPRHRSPSKQEKVNHAMQHITSDLCKNLIINLTPERQKQLARQLITMEKREKSLHRGSQFFASEFKRMLLAMSQGRPAEEMPSETHHMNLRSGFREKDVLEVRPHVSQLRR